MKTNMKAVLKFMDTREETRQGFKRGAIAFALIIVLGTIWFALFSDKYRLRKDELYDHPERSILLLLLSFVLFASALSVAHFTHGTDAFVYGILVGLVISGIANLTALAFSDEITTTGIFDTIGGMLLGGFISYILFVYERKKMTVRELNAITEDVQLS